MYWLKDLKLNVASIAINIIKMLYVMIYVVQVCLISLKFYLKLLFKICISEKCKLCCNIQSGTCQSIYGYKERECSNCLRWFNNPECYERHLKLACKHFHQCRNCQRVYNIKSKYKHACGSLYI